MIWKKPADIKYTEMCIFIDQNANKLIDPDCPEELQDKIYNYLWLIIKALSIKKRMFSSFQDYDGYAFYAANRIYFALKKNLENRGQIIKGKEIKPIKSCLNYIKFLMYPMKLEYLKEEYNADLTEEEVSKRFDNFVYKQRVRSEVWNNQGGSVEFYTDVKELFASIDETLDIVLAKSPFIPGTADYKKLKISILLNLLETLRAGKGLNAELPVVILWKLPKSTANYVRIFIKELCVKLKEEIMTAYGSSAVEDKIIDYMLVNPTGEFQNYEEQY